MAGCCDFATLEFMLQLATRELVSQTVVCRLEQSNEASIERHIRPVL